MTLLVKHICESYSTGESGICVFYLGYKLLDLNFPTSHAIFLPCLASELKENHIHTKWNIKGKKSTSKVDTIARTEKHNPKWGGLGGWHSVLRKLSRERPAGASHPVKMLAARTPGPCCPSHHLLSSGGAVPTSHTPRRSSSPVGAHGCLALQPWAPACWPLTCRQRAGEGSASQCVSSTL